MKLYNLAYKNVKGNLYRYIMYYFSNMFSVMLFFIFANFIFNPEVSNLNGSKNAMFYSISRGLIACEVVIIVFTFFFVKYSNSTFLKSRGREFGLLSLFGMTKNQIRKYAAYENVIVSLLSILGGIILGGLFSKLFFMAVEAAAGYGAVIKFAISLKAVLITVISFFILFQVINLLSLRRINSKTIAVQLKSAKIPKPVPKFSNKLAALGILLIAAGYTLAWFSNVKIIITMFPVLFFTIAGTYFLFTQFSIAITRRLQNNKRIFYKKTNMVILSQIIYKLRDNARVFFIIAILGAVSLTAAGTLYALYKQTQDGIKDSIPQHIAIIEKNNNSNNDAVEKKIFDIFKKNNIKVINQYKFMSIKGTWKYEKNDGNKSTTGNVLAISCSDYNRRAKALGLKHLDVRGNKVVIIKLNKWGGNPLNRSYNINGPVARERITGSFYGKVMSVDFSISEYAAVLSDDYFLKAVKQTPSSKIIEYCGYDIDKWKSGDALKAVSDIQKTINDSNKMFLEEMISSYNDAINSMSMVMLIGLFIALLFLISTGSMIYFKLFSELNEDRDEFISLMKMGTTRKEINRIINVQMVVIFFLPFIIACSHASFALKTLSDILQKNLVSVGLSVIFVYFVFQILYYFIIKSIYRTQIKMI